MQLRVSKKYQPQRRRRRTIRPSGCFFKVLLLVALVGVALWLLTSPDDARDRVSNAANNIADEVGNRYEQAFPEQPTPTPDVRSDVICGENAYLRGDMEEAIECYREALAGRPNDVELHFRLAHTLIITSNRGEDQQRMQEALAVAERTINANPESSLGWAIKAMALDWTQQYGQALAAAERANELDPTSILTKAILANIYRNLGQPDRAQNTIDEAIETLERQEDPDPEVVAQVYRNYGILQASQGNFEEAIEPFQVAYQAMPTHTYIAVELASQVYWSLQQYTIATDLLESVRDSNPRDPLVLYWLATLYNLQGQADEAKQLLTLCVDSNPEYVPCLSNLGQLQYFSDEYLLSRDNLERATEGGSEDPYDWYLLGRSLYRLQRCNEAIGPLRTGYELIQETTSPQVDQSDFVTALRDCNVSVQ
jgi:tetratricopeptide (TPR) repeat protein